MNDATSSCDIGLIGLAVMRANFALNMADHGYQRRGLQPHDLPVTEEFIREEPANVIARRLWFPRRRRSRTLSASGEAAAAGDDPGQGRPAGTDAVIDAARSAAGSKPDDSRHRRRQLA